MINAKSLPSPPNEASTPRDEGHTRRGGEIDPENKVGVWTIARRTPFALNPLEPAHIPDWRAFPITADFGYNVVPESPALHSEYQYQNAILPSGDQPVR